MIDEIAGMFGLISEIKPEKFRYSVYGRRGGIFEGVRRIAELSADKILLCTRGGVISVTGQNLRIKCFGERETVILGEITGVAVG